jgi:hypothetical protein
MQNRILYWNCGHKTTDPGVKTGKGKVVCPRCKIGSLMTIRIFCESCKKEIGFFGRNMNRKEYFCKECKVIRKKTILVKRELKNGTRKKTLGKIHKIQIRHPDCKFYESKCLPKASFSRNNKFSCKDCPDYVPMPLSSLNFLRAQDSFSTTGLKSNPRPR